MQLKYRKDFQWVISELATFRFGAVLVPLYDTLGKQAQTFSLNQVEAEIVICDTAVKATGLSIKNSVKYFFNYFCNNH